VSRQKKGGKKECVGLEKRTVSNVGADGGGGDNEKEKREVWRNGRMEGR
jgi:hypothetical protein